MTCSRGFETKLRGPRRPLALLVISLIAPWSLAGVVSAQDAEPPPGGTAPGDVFPPEEPEQAPTPEEAEARERFSQGLTLARSGDCSGAIAELTASYDLVPRPNTLFNIARCEEELALYDRAIANYERYLETADADAEDRATVQASMRTLDNLLGTIEVESNVTAEIWLGSRRIGQAPGTVRVPGGRHLIELRADDYLPDQQEVEVAGRQSRVVSFTLEQAEQHIEQNINQNIDVTRIEEGGLSPVFFYATLGLTLAAAGVGTALGIRALGLKSDAEAIDPRAPRDEQISEIQDAALLADVLFIGAGVLAAGTVLTFFLTDWDGEGGDEEIPVEVAVGPGLINASVQGTF